MDLLIPSAKIVSEELQNLGKLPAVIYPVNGRMVFSYLYKQYSSVCNIKVLCYENADKVHKKLEKYNEVRIIDIPKLRDLGDTIYYGINDEIPLIINFGDTIVMDNIHENSGDCFYYSEDNPSEKWTFFEINQGELINIYDKTKLVPQNIRKLFVGVFYISNSKDFKKSLEEAFLNKDKSISSFYKALKLYSEVHPLKAIKTDNWFDIGHAEKYYESKLEVQAREFNHIEIDKQRGILTKKSENKNKFIEEIKWYLKIPSDIEYIRPRIFDYSLDNNRPYVKMEYYAYHTIHELFLNGDLNEGQWTKIFNSIKFVYHDMQRYKIINENIVSSLENMYLIKTLVRLEKLRDDERYNSFFNNPIYINGKKYKPLNSIINDLKIIIPLLLFDIHEFNIIHGDFCFTNILIDNNFSLIKTIDPRGKFGNFDIYGDSRYELAKLLHSIDGKYDYIIEDLFEIKINDNQINYTIYDKGRDFDLYKVFIDVFKDEIGENIKKIELIESLLFLSMIPLHNENFDHQMVMLATGLEILNRVENIIESRLLNV